MLQGNNMSLNQLQPLVFDQWLMSDLRELGCESLPQGIVNQVSTFLNGPIALQVKLRI